MFRAQRLCVPAYVPAYVPACVIGLTLAAALTACSGDDAPEPDPTPEPVALGDLDTTGLVVARDAFCDSVDATYVEAATGADESDVDATTWANGEEVALSADASDLAHENGCAWSSEGTRAAAWVFVPPVTAESAESYVSRAAEVEGCETLEGQPAYGSPTLASSCVGEETTEVSFRGLFGDAWLTCTLSEPTTATSEDLVERASAWCGAIAVAASS